MLSQETIVIALGAATCILPLALVVCLGLASLLGRPLNEGPTSALIQLTTVLGLCAAAGLLIYMLASGQRHVMINLGDWAFIHDHDKHNEFTLSVKLVFDRLSVPF